MSNKPHYTALDGMRGVAAIAVVITHGEQYFGSLKMPDAYLAVDFFFVLSGFVIAYAYGAKLAGPMRAGVFLRARIIRLFPLYLAGTGITMISAFLAIFVMHDASTWTRSALILSIPSALLMLPSPFGILGRLFPLNFPGWSLFYEMLVNIVYATLRARIMPVLWVAMLAASATGIVTQAFIFGGVNQGALWSTGAWALARVFYSFPIGVLLYHWHRRIRLPAISTVPLIVVLVALLAFNPSNAFRPFYDVIFVLVLSPALVMLGANARPARLERVYAFLGLISYPIYMLHEPVYALVTGASHRYAPAFGNPAWAPWSGFALLAVLVAMSWIAANIDAGLQRRMKRAFTFSTGSTAPVQGHATGLVHGG